MSVSSGPQGRALRRTVNETQVGQVVLPNTLEESQHCGESGPSREGPRVIWVSGSSSWAVPLQAWSQPEASVSSR